MTYDTVSEKSWQAEVVEAMQLLGWRHYATFDSRHSVAGFPDLLAIHPKTGDMLVAELKRQKGSATPRQLEWLAWFEVAGIDAFVWRPSDIDEVLDRLRHPRERKVTA